MLRVEGLHSRSFSLYPRRRVAAQVTHNDFLTMLLYDSALEMGPTCAARPPAPNCQAQQRTLLFTLSFVSGQRRGDSMLLAALACGAPLCSMPVNRKFKNCELNSYVITRTKARPPLTATGIPGSTHLTFVVST